VRISSPRGCVGARWKWFIKNRAGRTRSRFVNRLGLVGGIGRVGMSVMEHGVIVSGAACRAVVASMVHEV